MSSDTKRYPHSTADGRAIPFEIMKPYGLVPLSFVTASASGLINVPTEIEIISVLVTEDAIIKFGGSAAMPANGVLEEDMAFLKKNSRTSIAPPAATFSIRGVTSAGQAYIQFIENWAGLSLEVQTRKR